MGKRGEHQKGYGLKGGERNEGKKMCGVIFAISERSENARRRKRKSVTEYEEGLGRNTRQ